MVMSSIRLKFLRVKNFRLAVLLVVSIILIGGNIALGAWEIQASGISNELMDVHFIDENNGWAVGQHSTMIHTTNGGTTWTIKLPVFHDDPKWAEIPIKSVYFLDMDEGWLLKNVPYYSKDGGNNWYPLAVSYKGSSYLYRSGDYENIYFLGECGWISSYQLDWFYKTEDGGINWNFYDHDESGRIYFTDCSNGWAVSHNGVIRHTTDGGLNWQRQSSGTEEDLRNLYFTNRSNGWIVGDNGIILHTTDGGETWVPQISGTKNSLHGIYFIDSNNGWIVGDNGIILNTTNGGDTWNIQPFITDSDLMAVQFIGQNNGWAVGKNGIILHYAGEVQPPSLDIKVNGLDGPITLYQSDTLTVTVALDNNGLINNADWWLGADTPFGLWFYTSEGWTENWQPVYQGPLFHLDPLEVLHVPVSGLPAGTYTFYFGIDTDTDGDITWDSLYIDGVVVNITK